MGARLSALCVMAWPSAIKERSIRRGDGWAARHPRAGGPGPQRVGEGSVPWQRIVGRRTGRSVTDGYGSGGLFRGRRIVAGRGGRALPSPAVSGTE
jgi:hypothetical protein